MENNEWEMGRKTRYFNGTFKKARLDRGWSRQDVAKIIGCGKEAVASWELMNNMPHKKYHKKIEEVFGVPITTLFPEFLKVLKDTPLSEERYATVELEQLTSGKEEPLALESPKTVEQEVAKNIVKENLKKLLDSLSHREKMILSMRFGLDGYSPHTLEEVGNEFGVTRERIRLIEAKALSKLRKNLKIKSLREEAELAFDMKPFPQNNKVPVGGKPEWL